MSFNFIEVGHFYEDQQNSKIDLSYLSKIPNFLKNNGIFALFIDNYNASCSTLDVLTLKKEYERYFNTDIHVFYEGEMSRYYSSAISLFDTDDLVLVKYNRSGKIKLELVIGNDVRIGIADISPNFKISCVMLSFIWSLYRLGHFDGDCGNKITTIIDEQYKAVEDKVLLMFDYISKKKSLDYRNFIEYFYYKG